MRDVVTWESIVGKDFMEQFSKIAIAEYWATKKDIPIATVYGKYADMEVEKYHDKRALMRRHGWRAAILTKKGNLHFGITLYQGESPKELRYITLPEFIGKRQADDLVRYADEWDAQQDAERKVAGMARSFKIKKNDVFVKEL